MRWSVLQRNVEQNDLNNELNQGLNEQRNIIFGAWKVEYADSLLVPVFGLAIHLQLH